jgi:hypothetical protein
MTKDLIKIRRKAKGFRWFKIKVTELKGEDKESHTIDLEDHTLNNDVQDIVQKIKDAFGEKDE